MLRDSRENTKNIGHKTENSVTWELGTTGSMIGLGCATLRRWKGSSPSIVQFIAGR